MKMMRTASTPTGTNKKEEVMENTIKKIKELTAKVENSGNINDAEELMAEVYLLMLKIDPKFIPKTAYIHYLAKERQYFDDEFETVMEKNQTADCVRYYKGLSAEDKEKFKDTILENIKRARLYTVADETEIFTAISEAYDEFVKREEAKALSDD